MLHVDYIQIRTHLPPVGTTETITDEDPEVKHLLTFRHFKLNEQKLCCAFLLLKLIFGNLVRLFS